MSVTNIPFMTYISQNYKFGQIQTVSASFWVLVSRGFFLFEFILGLSLS